MKKILTKINVVKAIIFSWWYKTPPTWRKSLREALKRQIRTLAPLSRRSASAHSPMRAKFSPLFFSSLVILLGVIGCRTNEVIPVESNVLIRDSIVRVVDTVQVEVPVEVISETVEDTISILSTSVAKSKASITGGKLTHSLEQRGTLPVKIDTCYLTKIEERKFFQVLPPVKVTEVPSWFKYSIFLNIFLIVLIIIYFKFFR